MKTSSSKLSKIISINDLPFSREVESLTTELERLNREEYLIGRRLVEIEFRVESIKKRLCLIAGREKEYGRGVSPILRELNERKKKRVAKKQRGLPVIYRFSR